MKFGIVTRLLRAWDIDMELMIILVTTLLRLGDRILTLNGERSCVLDVVFVFTSLTRLYYFDFLPAVSLFYSISIFLS